jgi:hypothetical protein
MSSVVCFIYNLYSTTTMSFAQPPPAPIGLPLPGQPPPLMHHAPPPMPHQTMAAARSFQILLSHLPSFLHNTRLLRDWIMSAGSARSVLLVPPPNATDKTSEDDSAQTNITALVTMSHADAALKVIAAFRHFSMKLKDTEFAEFSAYAVPTNPDVPTPPAVMDAETVTVLGNNLYNAFQRYRGGSAADSRLPPNSNLDSEQLIRNKIPVASEGADDDDQDPLNAPAVLEAVRKFREQLSVQQGSKAVRRQQLVKEAIAKMLPVIRQRVKQERERVSQAPPPPLPPPPGGAFPLPPPHPPTLDAPRGVSNKPAWMTQQKQQQQADNEQPPMKKLKVDLTNPDVLFPLIPESSVTALRQFIAASIKHYLGEEEATLIDFVNQHVLSGKSVSALLPELSDVLDDDAGAFLQAVYEQSQQLASS